MIAKNAQEIEGVPVTSAPYKGKSSPVEGVTIRWLSKAGQDENGNPAYGLRHFTVEPGGSIPMHAHGYLQTVYVESGSFECYAYDPDSGEVTDARICNPGDFCFSPSMEPHGMRNLSDTEPGTFLCCIGCVAE